MRKRGRLDSSALRARFFAYRGSSERIGVGWTRREVIKGAGAALAAFPAAVAVLPAVPVLSLKRVRGGILLLLDGEARFALRASDYVAAPSLSGALTATRLRMAARAGRFPGTATRSDVILDARFDGARWRARLRVPGVGAVATGDLLAWLQGGLLAGTTTTAFMRFVGEGALSLRAGRPFTIDRELRLHAAGRDLAMFRRGEDLFAADAIALRVGRQGIGVRRPREYPGTEAHLALSRAPSAPLHALGQLPAGVTSNQRDTRIERLELTADERWGQPRLKVALDGRGGSLEIALPGQEGDGASLAIGRVQHVSLITSDGEEGHLIADIAPAGAVLDAVGVRLGIGSGEGEGGLEVRNASGQLDRFLCSAPLDAFELPLGDSVVQHVTVPAKSRIGLWFDWSATPPAGQWCTLHLNSERHPVLRLAHFTTSILRPQDMLLLGFDFTGVEIRHRHGRPLIYKQPGQPAYLRVNFPPQHVAEVDVQWMAEGYDTSIPAPDNHRTPLPGPPDPLRRAFGSALTPPSRLVFRLPPAAEEEGLRFDVDTLLDWSALQMAVNPRAPARKGSVRPLLPEDWRDHEWPDGETPSPPAENDTAVHVQKMIFSPNGWSTWFHSRQPATSMVTLTGGSKAELTELWHTRLAPFQADSVDRHSGAIRARREVINGKDPRRRDDLRTVRAISTSPDQPPDNGPVQPANWRINPALPDDRDADDIVRLSSDFSLRFCGCDGSDTRYDPVPIDYRQLHLSALGATMDLHAHWPTGVHDGTRNFTNVEYTHRTVNGRDVYVAVATLGFTLWTGHEVLFVRARPREDVVDETGGRTAAPRRRFWCEVSNATIEYPMPPEGHRILGRRTTFRKVKIEPAKTVMLEEPIDLLTGQQTDKPKAFWMIPEGAAKDDPFRFKFTAEDWDGRQIVFSMPLLWVEGGLAARVFNMCGTAGPETLNPQLQKVVRDYYDGDTLYPPWRSASLGNQKVNVIPDVGDKSRDRSLEVEQIQFTVDLLGQGDVRWPDACHWPVQFYPAAAFLTARTGATSRLGSATPARVYRYNGWYAAYGLAPTIAASETVGAGKSANPGGIYLDVLAPQEPHPGMGFPAEKTGGMAQPSLAIRHIGLSGPIGGARPDDTREIRYVPLSAVGQGPSPLVRRAAGVTAQTYVDSSAIKGVLDPKDMFSRDMKLFGAISFADICREIDGFQEIADSIPRLEEQYRQAVAPVLSSINQARAEFDRIRTLPQQLQEAMRGFQDRLIGWAHDVQTAVTNELLGVLLAAQEQAYAKLDLLRDELEAGVAGALGKLNAAYDSVDPAAYEKRLRQAASDAELLRQRLRIDAVADAFRKDLQGAVDSVAAFARGGFPFGRYVELPGLLEGAVRRFGEALANPAQLPDALANLQRSVQDVQALVANADEAAQEAQEATTLGQLAVNAKRAFPVLSAAIATLDARMAAIRDETKTAWFRVQWPTASDADRLFESSRRSAWLAAETAINGVTRGLVAEAQGNLSLIVGDAERKIENIKGKITRFIDSAASQLGDAQKKLADVIGPFLAEVDTLLDALPQTIDLNYGFEPALHDSGVFLASLDGKAAHLKIAIRITQDLRTVDKGPDYAFSCDLTNSRLVIPPSTPFLEIGLERVSFTSRNGQRPDVSLKLGAIKFAGQLDFVSALEKLLNPTSGPYLEIDTTAISAGFRLPVPSITTGAFSLTDLSINPEVRLLLDGSPMRGRVAVSSRAKPAIMAFGIYGGTLFAAVETGPDKAVFIEGAIDGGLVSVFDFAGATGCATATVGIYFKMAAQAAQLSGYFRAHGSFDVYGLITLNIDFYLGLTYESGGSARGVCRISVSIGQGIFSFTVGVTAERQLHGSSGSSRDNLVAFDGSGRYDGVFRLGSPSEAAWLRQQARFGSWNDEPAYG
jgi:hypothetical protein